MVKISKSSATCHVFFTDFRDFYHSRFFLSRFLHQTVQDALIFVFLEICQETSSFGRFIFKRPTSINQKEEVELVFFLLFLFLLFLFLLFLFFFIIVILIAIFTIFVWFCFSISVNLMSKGLLKHLFLLVTVTKNKIRITA